MEQVMPIQIMDRLVQSEWRNVCVLIHQGEATVAAARACGEAYRRMSQQHPEGFAVLVVVEPGVPLPGDEVRRIISEIMSDMAPSIRSMCGVYEATGFVGAAMRSMLVAMTVLSRPPYRTHTTGDLHDGCTWLAPWVEPAASPAQLEAVVREVRTRASALRASGMAATG